MELKRLGSQEILHITEDDDILEYKISRTEDNRLVLEIKVDISDSVLEISSLTDNESGER